MALNETNRRLAAVDAPTIIGALIREHRETERNGGVADGKEALRIMDQVLGISQPSDAAYTDARESIVKQKP